MCISFDMSLKAYNLDLFQGEIPKANLFWDNCYNEILRGLDFWMYAYLRFLDFSK